MNTELVKQEIAKLLNEVKQPSRKQYPVTKKQTTELTELGLIDLMPSGFGYTDAAVVISAAKDNGGKQIGEGDTAISSDASKLFQILNTVEESVMQEISIELPIGILWQDMNEEDFNADATDSIYLDMLSKELMYAGYDATIKFSQVTAVKVCDADGNVIEDLSTIRSVMDTVEPMYIEIEL